MSKAGEWLNQTFLQGSGKAIGVAWTTSGGAINLVVTAVSGGRVSLWYGFAIGAFIALFIVVQNVSRDLGRVRSELDAIYRNGPRIRFDKVKVAPSLKLRVGEKDGDSVKVWQLWFNNRPENQTLSATARNLTAWVEFYDSEQREPVVEFSGPWAITRHPGHAGWVKLEEMVDLPPVHRWAKLLLIAESIDWHIMSGNDAQTREIFGLAAENLFEQPLSADHPSYVIPMNATRVRVRLIAENMREQEMEFTLEREPDGAVKGVALLTL